MKLTLVTEHFKQPSAGSTEEEFEESAKTAEPRSFVRLTKEGIEYLSQYYTLVRNVADLDTFGERLPKGREFGFCPLFAPDLIDSCCVRGIFPMTTEISNIYLFAPKLHTTRCVVVLVPKAEKAPADAPLFDDKLLGVSKHLRRAPLGATRRPCFDVFVNRTEDVADVFTLIVRQHGENWMCKRLRTCFMYMFAHQSEFRTKIIVTAVRRHAYTDAAPAEAAEGASRAGAAAEVKEGELVAGEVGFLVGDVYTSATGGYCLSGAGSLQLAVLGAVLRRAGCQIWDLGMAMDYKTEKLSGVNISRKRWVSLITAHAKDSTTNRVVAELSSVCGMPVSELL